MTYDQKKFANVLGIIVCGLAAVGLGVGVLIFLIGGSIKLVGAL